MSSRTAEDRDKSIEEEYGFSDSDEEPPVKVDMSKPETPEETAALDVYMRSYMVQKYIQGGASENLRRLRAEQTRGQALLRMRLVEKSAARDAKSRQFYDRIERQRKRRAEEVERGYHERAQNRRKEEEAEKLIAELMARSNPEAPVDTKNEPIEIDDDDDNDE